MEPRGQITLLFLIKDEVQDMLINSEQFGQVEVPEAEIVAFPQGLYGFEYLKRFVLLGNTGEPNPFMWLHAVDDPAVCFVVIDPFVFKKDFSPELTDDILDLLNVDNAEDLRVLAIVNIPEDISRMSANLKSPVIINSAKNIAVQLVMDSDKYGFKHYILDEMQKTA
jgi:flagellar assembly factor FliW